MKSQLIDKYPGLGDSGSGPVSILKSQYGGDILAYLTASRALDGGLWKEAPGCKDYPGIVGLYFVLLEMEEVPGDVVSKLLARRQYVERFIILMHICVAKRTAFSAQVAYLMTDDPISVVRGCASKVLEHLGSVQVTDHDAYARTLYERLISKERENVVLDLEFTTYCDDVSKVPEYLMAAIHGESLED